MQPKINTLTSNRVFGLRDQIEDEDVADQESLIQPSKVADSQQSKIRPLIASTKSLRSRQESIRSYKSSVLSEGSEITTTQTVAA